MNTELSTASTVANTMRTEGADWEDIHEALISEFRSMVTNNVGASALVAWLDPLFIDKARWAGSRGTTEILNRSAQEARTQQVRRIDDGAIVEGPYAHLFNSQVMDRRISDGNGRLMFLKHMTRAQLLDRVDYITKQIAGNVERRDFFEGAIAALDAVGADTLEEARLKVTVQQKVPTPA